MPRSRTFLSLASLLLLGALGLSAQSLPAQAQPASACYDHDKVISRFAVVYDEAPVAAGLTQDGRMIEVLSSGDGLTWTIIVSKPDGETCVLLSGEGWRASTHKPILGDVGT